MERLRTWLVVSGILLLASGTTLGLVLGRYLPGGRSAAPRGSSLIPPEPSSQWPQWLLSSRDVWQELGLTAKQQETLSKAFGEHYRKDRALREELEKLWQDAQAQVLGVLTPEQRRSFEYIQERYADARIGSEVIREIAQMRRDIALAPEQEIGCYQVLYQAHCDRRDLWRALHEAKPPAPPDHEVFRKKMREIGERQDEGLARILDAPQLEKYRQIQQERMKRFVRRDRDRDRDRERERREKREEQRDDCDEPDAAPQPEKPPAEARP
jgi:hypothetical protein